MTIGGSFLLIWIGSLHRVDVPHLHATHSIGCLVSPNYPLMLYGTRSWRPHMLNASSLYPNPIASLFAGMLPIVTRFGHACSMKLRNARLPCEWWTPCRVERKIAITIQCTRVAGREFFQWSHHSPQPRDWYRSHLHSFEAGDDAGCKAGINAIDSVLPVCGTSGRLAKHRTSVGLFLDTTTPSSTDSLETVESYAAWKRALYVPVGLVAFVLAPITTGLARFVSLYPPCPLKFVWSLTIIASVAGITHLTSSPLKGPANTSIVLLSIAVCALVIFGFGFQRERDASTNPHQTP